MTSLKGTISRRLDEGPVHVTLIDPDKQTTERAASMAVQAQEGGTHVLLVGGTTGVGTDKLDDTLRAVKEAADLPLIIFPASSDSISTRADAIFFMSLLNSRSVRYVIREAAKASIELSRSGLEVLPVGYIVFEPGMVVGSIGDVDLISRDDVRTAREYAKASELFGMGYCYLEGGSGVLDPVPSKIISGVKEELSIPLIVGGGITDPKRAEEAVRSGADIIVTGSLVERNADISGAIEGLIGGMERGWRKRL